MSRVLLAVAVVVGVSAVGRADQVPKPWPDTYAQIVKALEHKDVKGYGAFLDKSFAFTDTHNKTQTLVPYLKGMTASLKQVSNIKITLTPSNYRKQGDDILMTYDYRFEADLAGERHIKFFERGTDTWRKIGGKYLEVKEVATKEGLIPDKPASPKTSA